MDCEKVISEYKANEIIRKTKRKISKERRNQILIAAQLGFCYTDDIIRITDSENTTMNDIVRIMTTRRQESCLV